MSGFVIVSVSSSRRPNRLKSGVSRLQFLHRRLERTSSTLRGSSGNDWQDGAWCQYICCMFCDNRTMRGRIGRRLSGWQSHGRKGELHGLKINK